MYPSTSGSPTPISSLDTLLDEGTALQKPMKVFVGHNLGSRAFTMYVPLHEFYEMSAVANDPGRPFADLPAEIDLPHATKLAHYMLKGLVHAAIHRRVDIEKRPIPAEWLELQDLIGKQPYLALQPLVVNIRNCNPAGSNIGGMRLQTVDGETAAFKIFLSQQHVLWVVDGQHRRKGNGDRLRLS